MKGAHTQAFPPCGQRCRAEEQQISRCLPHAASRPPYPAPLMRACMTWGSVWGLLLQRQQLHRFCSTLTNMSHHCRDLLQMPNPHWGQPQQGGIAYLRRSGNALMPVQRLPELLAEVVEMPEERASQLPATHACCQCCEARAPRKLAQLHVRLQLLVPRVLTRSSTPNTGHTVKHAKHSSADQYQDWMESAKQPRNVEEGYFCAAAGACSHAWVPMSEPRVQTPRAGLPQADLRPACKRRAVRQQALWR